jgi:hypothetical protein
MGLIGIPGRLRIETPLKLPDSWVGAVDLVINIPHGSVVKIQR